MPAPALISRADQHNMTQPGSGKQPSAPNFTWPSPARAEAVPVPRLRLIARCEGRFRQQGALPRGAAGVWTCTSCEALLVHRDQLECDPCMEPAGQQAVPARMRRSRRCQLCKGPMRPEGTAAPARDLPPWCERDLIRARFHYATWRRSLDCTGCNGGPVRGGGQFRGNHRGR